MSQNAAPVEHHVRAGSSPALSISLDVHTESIAVSIAPRRLERGPLLQVVDGGRHDDVLRLAKKLQAAHPGVTLRFVHKAWPHGHPLCW